MFVDSCISFFIALNVVILTSNIIIFSLVNLRKQVETDCEEAVKRLEGEVDKEIDYKDVEEIIVKVMKGLGIAKLKIKKIGSLSLLNIYLIFLIFFYIFLTFFLEDIFLDYFIMPSMFISLVLFFMILHFFKFVYDFDPKEQISKWKISNRKKIRRDSYSSLFGALVIGGD